MSDTTITPEERARLHSVLSEHGTPQVEDRIILRLLNTIEQAEARALRWTNESPKVAGWYFQRTAGEDQTINVAYVYSGLAGLYCKCGCRNTPLKCWIGFEWAGPISPPID